MAPEKFGVVEEMENIDPLWRDVNFRIKNL